MSTAPPQPRVIATTSAPQAIGPYSQAIVVPPGHALIFCSGQIALSPVTGLLLGGGDVVAEAEQVMHNLHAVLQAAGAGFQHVVKTTIFLHDMADFPRVNEVYGRAFAGGPLPARATVQAAGLPRGARVEIEAIAAVPASS